LRPGPSVPDPVFHFAHGRAIAAAHGVDQQELRKRVDVRRRIGAQAVFSPVSARRPFFSPPLYRGLSEYTGFQRNPRPARGDLTDRPGVYSLPLRTPEP